MLPSTVYVTSRVVKVPSKSSSAISRPLSLSLLSVLNILRISTWTLACAADASAERRQQRVSCFGVDVVTRGVMLSRPGAGMLNLKVDSTFQI